MTASLHGPPCVGIGGPVGSGKTALLEALRKRLRGRYELAAITNHSYAQETRRSSRAAQEGAASSLAPDLVSGRPRGHLRGGFDRRRRTRRYRGAREQRMASSLRRLIEDLAVVKPGRKTSRSLSDAAKASLGLNVPIMEILDNTLGPAPAQGTGAAPAEDTAVKI